MVEHPLDTQLAGSAMTRKEQDVLIKAHQAFPDRLQQQCLFPIAFGGTYTSAHQRIAGEQGVVYLVDQTVQAVTRNMDDLHIKITEGEHLVVADGFYRVLVCGKGRSVDGWIVYLDQCAEPCRMCFVPMGQKHMLELELVGFDHVYQFSIHMAGVDEDGIAAFLRSYEVGVAETYDRKMLVYPQWWASE